MPLDVESAYKRLRKYLNPAIDGENTQAVLETLAQAIAIVQYNAQAINDQCYISTASVQYLDQRLSDYGVTRAPEIGMPDDVFRRIGIEVINRKQVRDLLNQLLKIIFGDDVTQASTVSTTVEPYALQNDDQLLISYDSNPTITITFKTSDFANIAAATAQEVADTITKQIRAQGGTGRAYAADDGNGARVYLISDTIGPKGSVQVNGGRAQDVLVFPTILNLTPDNTTEWDITKPPTGKTKLEWTGVGTDPSLAVLKVGDYVNIYGLAFSVSNRGTFKVTFVDPSGNYIEFDNPSSVAETVTSDDVKGYRPTRSILTDNFRYAAQFQEEANLLELYIPATTKVVRRSRKGAAYLQDHAPSTPDNYGPYIYDPTQSYYITATQSVLAQDFGSNQGSIITLQSGEAASFPDEFGYVVLGIGTENEEGPIPYVARPSTSTLLLSPAYVVKNDHPARVFKINGADGTTIVDVTKDGYDLVIQSVGGTPFDFIANGVQAGDLVTLGSVFDPANQLTYGIKEVTATSITVENSSGVAESGITLGSASEVNIFSAGTDVALVKLGAYKPSVAADDYQFFTTDNIAGRIYAQGLLESIIAAGITVNFIIIYPNPIGLGGWEKENVGNEKKYVWGKDYQDVYEEG